MEENAKVSVYVKNSVVPAEYQIIFAHGIAFAILPGG